MVTKCGKCNRALKNTLSIQRGYGPLCSRKIKKLSNEGIQITDTAIDVKADVTKEGEVQGG